MTDVIGQRFLERVFSKLEHQPADGFSWAKWRFEDRPTSEALGRMSGISLDIQNTVDCILNVEAFPHNLRFVDRNNILERHSDSSLTFVQRMKIPVVGRVQAALNMADYGTQNGYRVVAWTQHDQETHRLPRQDGFRTEYSLGAWLIKEDELIFALSSSPRIDDIGRVKLALMNKGAEVMAGEILRDNIEAMSDWASQLQQQGNGHREGV